MECIYPCSHIPEALRANASSQSSRPAREASPGDSDDGAQSVGSDDEEEEPDYDAEPPLPPASIRLDGNNNIIAAIVPGNSTLVNAFDPEYLLWTHPSVFPWNKGKRPDKMSLLSYYQILLERAPLVQFGHNVGLLFDMFDIWQRNEVSDERH